MNKNVKKTKINTNNIFPRTRKKIKDFTERLDKEQLVSYGYMLFVLYICILAMRYIRAIIWLDKVVITNNPILIILCVAAPVGLWVYSTIYDHWNYHNRKVRWLYAVVISAVATIEQPIIYISWNFLVVHVLQIEVTQNMTKNMVVTLGRICMVVPLIIGTALIAVPIYKFISSQEIIEKIEAFKIKHLVDMRKNKENLYDSNIIRDLKTGKVEPIHEHDRLVHTFINGQSGTGKTSSAMIPAVAEDLNRKVANMLQREKALLQMIKEKKAYVAGPYTHVDDTNVRPKPKYKKEFEKIWETYPDCGITVMAPNNDMNNTIVKLCQARKIPVNVVDPAKKYTEKNVIAKGIQNFYIPLNLSEKERSIRILEQAQTFSEVMVAANEAEGTSDVYFRDINTSVTTNIATVCMLAANIQGKQTNIKEIQDCINFFPALSPLVDIIEEYYGIHVKTTEIKTKIQDATRDNLGKSKLAGASKGGKDNPYHAILLFIKQELLGPGAEKMFDQARGLRNLINKIIADPRYMQILSAPIDQALNFDEMLLKNQVTVVNTALEFGAQKSTSLGLIFLLNFQTAVLRRPQGTRSIHFILVDEASQYMHKVYDNMFALFRQYGVATTRAMQTISQMDKNKTTEDLKNIILGAGTQIVYGRVSAEEMKLYSELAGSAMIDTIQHTISTTSLFSSSVSQSMSDRTTQQLQSNIEGTKIRVRDFQEVTVFKIRDGRVMGGFLGKTNFLDKSELEDQGVMRVNFRKYAPAKKEVELTKPAENLVKEQENLLIDTAGSMKVMTVDLDNQMTKIPVDTTLEVPVKDNLESKNAEISNTGKSPIESLFGNLFEEDEVIEDVELYDDGLGDEQLE